MPSITLSEALQAIKQTAGDPQTVAREIQILEDEIAQHQQRIKSNRQVIRMLRRMAGKKSGDGGSQAPRPMSPSIAKVFEHLKHSKPATAQEIAKATNVPIGALSAMLQRRTELFHRDASNRWSVVEQE